MPQQTNGSLPIPPHPFRCFPGERRQWTLQQQRIAKWILNRAHADTIDDKTLNRTRTWRRTKSILQPDASTFHLLDGARFLGEIWPSPKCVVESILLCWALAQHNVAPPQYFQFYVYNQFPVYWQHHQFTACFLAKITNKWCAVHTVSKCSNYVHTAASSILASEWTEKVCASAENK